MPNLNIVTGAKQATLLNPIILDNSFGSPIYGSVTYSITGGADAALFTLGPQDWHKTSTLVPLSFNTPPDMASPNDAGQDHIYDVELTATFVSLGFGPKLTYSLKVVGDDFADTVATTGRLATDGTPATGVMDAQNDVDWYRFESAGGDYLVSSSLSQVTIYDANGNLVGGSGGALPVALFTPLPAGTLYLAAYSFGSIPDGTNYTVSIRAGGDVNYGTPGNDVINGSAGRDYLRGGEGADSILGRAGDDDINGNQGNDIAYGGDGNDWVVGGQDNDQLYGENGADIVYGNLGDDTGFGGAGDDWVRGGQGNDYLFGDAGNDFMSGDRGDDTLYGGAGADRFNLIAGAGIDRVIDFNSAQGDRVVIEGAQPYTLSFIGGAAHIVLADGSDMVLVGVSNAAQLGVWLGG